MSEELKQIHFHTRHLKWSQKQITDWATKNFGWNGPLTIAIRGNKEMSELLSALSNDDGKKPGKALEHAMECADVAIFLLQICERLGYDLLGLVDAKMDINEKRQWGKAADGSFQHLEKNNG